MEKLKQKWYDIVLILVCIAVVIFFDNRNVRIIGIVAVIFCAIDFFSKPVEEKKVEHNENVLSDEEMEQELLGDGEFSYDNYDEVCCPKCGAFIGQGVTSCKQCGYGKSDYPEVCPNCGKPNEDKLPFCAYCNSKFDKISIKDDNKTRSTDDYGIVFGDSNDDTDEDVKTDNDNSEDNNN